jgi:ribosomal protein S18 acetylase RimI-like enzyme
LLRHLFEAGTALGCREAWVLTNQSNVAAVRLYGSVGGSDTTEEAPVMFTFRLDATDSSGR